MPRRYTPDNFIPRRYTPDNFIPRRNSRCYSPRYYTPSFPRKRESRGLHPKPRLCQNQDLQDFAFDQPAPFAITENPANSL